MQQYGIPDVRIDAVPVLLNTPATRLVEIVYPPDQLFTASLEEPVKHLFNSVIMLSYLLFVGCS